jgi:ADP-ribose pyrophosphatase YjhB (NUDIX family)
MDTVSHSHFDRYYNRGYRSADTKLLSLNNEIKIKNIPSANFHIDARSREGIRRSLSSATTIKQDEIIKDHHPCTVNKHRLILDTPFSTRSTISYGLIVFAKNTGRWAIIQRKHSVEFLLFIRGIYRLTYLPILLSCVTVDEASIIEQCLKNGPDFFKDIYLHKLGLSSDGLSYALIRMAESHHIVLNMLPKLDLLNNDLRWTWPKGRLHISSNRETPFECAKREFAEEVEILLPPPLFISDTYVSENIKTITGRNIESRYWIYIIPTEIPMFPPESHPEVANRSWVDTDTCRSKIGRDTLLNHIISIVSSIDSE